MKLTQFVVMILTALALMAAPQAHFSSENSRQDSSHQGNVRRSRRHQLGECR